MTLIRSFLKDESGATAIEYGLIAALIAVAVIGALGALGQNAATNFQQVADAMAVVAEDTEDPPADDPPPADPPAE